MNRTSLLTLSLTVVLTQLGIAQQRDTSHKPEPSHASAGLPQGQGSYRGNAVPKDRGVRVEDHVITADNDGWPMQPSYDFASNKPGAKRIATRAEVDATYAQIVARLRDQAPRVDGKRQILIFIHGGMNFRTGAIENAARHLNEKQYHGLNDAYYPIFITWNSAPFSCWSEHLLSVRNGSAHPESAWVTAPFCFASDVARGITRIPLAGGSLIGRVEHRTSGHAIVAQEVYKVAGKPEVTHDTYRQLDFSDARTEAKSLAHTACLPGKTVGLFVLDTIGTGAWNMMLRRANLLFDRQEHAQDLRNNRTAESYRKEILKLVEKTREPGAETGAAEAAKWFLHDSGKLAYPSRSDSGAVESFLKQLEAGTRGDESLARQYSITLVGHSMGAIVADEMIKRHPELPFDKIVYMAAACSMKECKDAVGPYLQRRLARGNPAHFYGLSLHPTAERDEAAFSPDPLSTEEKSVGAVALAKKQTARAGQALLSYTLTPRGSLLEWLDAFFTTPINIEDRRMGKWETALTTMNAFPEEIRPYIHLKMYPRAEGAEVLAAGNPQKHGQFSRMEFWKTEFREPKVIDRTGTRAAKPGP